MSCDGLLFFAAIPGWAGRIALIASCLIAADRAVVEASDRDSIMMLPAWVFATQGLKAATQYGLVLLGCLLVVSAVFVLTFGRDDLMFNLVRLPQQAPFHFQVPENVFSVRQGNS